MRRGEPSHIDSNQLRESGNTPPVGGWHFAESLRFLVASRALWNLLLCAKHLFFGAIQHRPCRRAKLPIAARQSGLPTPAVSEYNSSRSRAIHRVPAGLQL